MNKLIETLIVSVDNGIGSIRFNRPDRLNAVTELLYQELQEALHQFASNPKVKVIVLTGEGRAFCVGADMKAHAGKTRTAYDRREYLKGEQDICKLISQIAKPVVAAVNGYALGAGAEMAIAADFILMSEQAQIGLPEVTIGTFLGGGVTHTLPRLVGLAKARELVFLGERLDGPEAVRIGLANRSFPAESFHQDVTAFCEQLNRCAPISMALAKEQINASADRDFDSALLHELEGMTFCTTTKDWQEGVDAFKEKRSPNFIGQ